MSWIASGNTSSHRETCDMVKGGRKHWEGEEERKGDKYRGKGGEGRRGGRETSQREGRKHWEGEKERKGDKNRGQGRKCWRGNKLKQLSSN